MSLMKFFTIREVPTTRWSSEYPLNIKPRIETLFMVFVGNIIFGFGVAVIIAAGAGLDPWTILAEGLGLIFDVSIGFATFIVSVSVLLLWIPLRQMPGFGTIINTIVVASMIDIALPKARRKSLVASAVSVIDRDIHMRHWKRCISNR